MTNPAYRSSGLGEPAQAGGGKAPMLPTTMAQANELPARLASLAKTVTNCRELYAEGSTVAADAELRGVQLELARLANPETPLGPPPAVSEAMARLRLLVRDLPEWKRVAVRIWLSGARSRDLYAMDHHQSRMLVIDLARLLALLEKGGAA